MPTFTLRVSAENAAELREARDTRLDAFPHTGATAAEIVAECAAAEVNNRAYWTKDAMERAINRLWLKANDAEMGDLDGATITLTVSDLVVTATLTTPENG